MEKKLHDHATNLMLLVLFDLGEFMLFKKAKNTLLCVL